MSELVCYQSWEIPKVWDKVKDHIEKALKYRGSNYSLDDIYIGLNKSDMQLWTSQGDDLEAALVTTIQIKDGMKFCLFLALGGTNLKSWDSWQSYIENWARKEGCEEMRIYGRIGWAKIVNYKVEYTKMSKKL